MTTFVKHILNKFDTFSEAFKYAVDKTGENHDTFYKKIPMDKGQWSKIYNGKTQKPRAKTRDRLTEVVGVEIVERADGSWELLQPEYKNENTIHDQNYVSEEEVRFRLNDVDEETIEEKDVDDLPQLVRLRDIIDRKIQKLIDRNRQ